MPGACSTPTRTADDLDDSAELTSADTSSIEEANEQVDDAQNSPIPDQIMSNSSAGSRHKPTPDYPPNKEINPQSTIQQITSTARELNNLSESVLCIDHGKESEWDIYGKSVAAQLKCLSPAQALYAQMEINNTLTKCRFNDLYGTPASPDRLLTVSTEIPSNNYSEVIEVSRDTEENKSIIASSTATPVDTFSEVFTAFEYKCDV